MVLFVTLYRFEPLSGITSFQPGELSLIFLPLFLFLRQKIFVKDEYFDFVPDFRVQFTEKLEDEEQAFRIHQFLHRMNDPYKEVFSLRVFGELPFERIGQLFGKSSSWARVTYHRARKQIMEYMEGLENE